MSDIVQVTIQYLFASVYFSYLLHFLVFVLYCYHVMVATSPVVSLFFLQDMFPRIFAWTVSSELLCF